MARFLKIAAWLVLAAGLAITLTLFRQSQQTELDRAMYGVEQETERNYLLIDRLEFERSQREPSYKYVPQPPFEYDYLSPEQAKERGVYAVWAALITLAAFVVLLWMAKVLGLLSTRASAREPVS